MRKDKSTLSVAVSCGFSTRTVAYFSAPRGSALLLAIVDGAAVVFDIGLSGDVRPTGGHCCGLAFKIDLAAGGGVLASGGGLGMHLAAGGGVLGSGGGSGDGLGSRNVDAKARAARGGSRFGCTSAVSGAGSAFPGGGRSYSVAPYLAFRHRLRPCVSLPKVRTISSTLAIRSGA